MIWTMFGRDKLNKRLSQIDFFIGVTGRTAEIVDRVYDEIVAVIERGASGLPADADLLMAARLLDDCDEGTRQACKDDGIDVLIWIFGKTEEAAQVVVESLKGETGPDKLTDPFFQSLRALFEPIAFDAASRAALSRDMKRKAIVPLGARSKDGLIARGAVAPRALQ